MAVAVIPAPDSGHEAFIESLRRFSRAQQRAKSRRRCGAGEDTLSLPQALLLSGLLHEPELTVGALAEHAMVSNPTATRMLDALERDGLVLRRKCERDRRAVLVSLTDEGRRVVEQSWSDLHDGLTRASASLSVRERSDATRLLDRLALLMDEI
ncbi:MarR family transcriptional regulator [Conexibacter sp. JD483]|uniref:MarR family winged helix-turn-helix transcriptional regulator n=1 Tax=unclassified Conexibacter TaxID=2627773 RepID=UPI00271634C2|nr:MULTISPECIES: MarR family transcriptional regulator [unclassified Conexibacter]MDO8188968.1 MarR family transcriptional regulator [Conexibacter sp. CPCC 205706]MDO8201776.1 MarR family transcriptional regulator [Conexibacter sp. CPCC 205762]MDR9371441.1 MarR family transcriptional regulator [Conexibacter sp. JD483]